ncbi:MAG: hypothetical protein WCS31_08410 [Verrucomicrobiae bacterium]
MKRTGENFIQLQIDVPVQVEQKAKRLAEEAGLSVSEYFGELVMKTADGKEGIPPESDDY